jgi:uncharacterized membrane protein YphA (DoxX/SURF4 family)
MAKTPASVKRSHQALALLRGIIGGFFLYDGYHRVIDPPFAAQLSGILSAWAAENPLFFYQDILYGILIPNAATVAGLLAYSELLIGGCFMLGFLMRWAIPLQIFLNANILMASQHTHLALLALNSLLIATGLVLLWGEAGRHYGLDHWADDWITQWLQQRKGGKKKRKNARGPAKIIPKKRVEVGDGDDEEEIDFSPRRSRRHADV